MIRSRLDPELYRKAGDGRRIHELAIKIPSPEVGGGPEVNARLLREAWSAGGRRASGTAIVLGAWPSGSPSDRVRYT